MLNAQQVQDYRIEIQKITDFPPLPVVANELLHVLSVDTADIDDICKIIVKDPGLTARLLGLSNSAFFGFGRKVNTLNEAIINVLGLDMVKGLALSLIMSGTFDVKRCSGFDCSRYWCSALLTADLVNSTARLLKPEIKVNVGYMYLYGLLHNLGILILVDRFPNTMDSIFKKKLETKERCMTRLEREHLSIDHHEAAVYLAHKWHLPEEIITVIEHHPDHAYRDENWHAVVLTGFCADITRNWIAGIDDTFKDEHNILGTLGIAHDNFQEAANETHKKIKSVKEIAAKMNG